MRNGFGDRPLSIGKEETAMRDSGMSAAKRIAAGVMALMMLALIGFSAFCIAAEAEHDCTGEDCPVCACVRQCGKTLRLLGTAAAARGFALAPVLAVLSAVPLAAALRDRETPVSGKVRLNN